MSRLTGARGDALSEGFQVEGDMERKNMDMWNVGTLRYPSQHSLFKIIKQNQFNIINYSFNLVYYELFN